MATPNSTRRKITPLTRERLLERVQYDPETGHFTWAIDYHRAKKGQRIGSRNSAGYLSIFIDGKGYKCHRLAWLYVHGVWPREYIDHINGDKGDNRITNLREATHQQNVHNQVGLRKNSRTKFPGAQWNAHKQNWKACVRLNGKIVYQRYFKTPEEASNAYIEAKRKLHEFSTL